MFPANEKCPQGDNRPWLLPALTQFACRPVSTQGWLPFPSLVCRIWMLSYMVALRIDQFPPSNCLPWLYVTVLYLFN